MVPRPSKAKLTQNRYLRRAYREQNVFASRRVRMGLLLGALGVYALQFVAGDRGLVRRLAMEKQVGQLHVMNASLVQERESLLRELNLQENDPLSLEKLAREKCWLAYEDEVIYRFEDDEVVPNLDLEGNLEQPAEAP